ncbi:hypothetical protein FISHEDRAFT_73066 [Fistulina hepatica ATCC 64428]|uniref:Uncharacterized protein n=1 Tax=Fistulina hepatica ATCC 64428 TaxID=1128425 RepID=A0A0D7AF20_9AGAR|nr:hypothetical protein FISHEDRAFT_73066 [Fistulina hepatica ATCC 64428]
MGQRKRPCSRRQAVPLCLASGHFFGGFSTFLFIYRTSHIGANTRFDSRSRRSFSSGTEDSAKFGPQEDEEHRIGTTGKTRI